MTLDPATNPESRLRQAAARASLEALVAQAPALLTVEQIVRSKFSSKAALLKEIPEYLLSLGGKRLRPLLALSSARLFGMHSPSPQLIDVSAGIELIHMATLLHDDIIDKSPLRRHRESPFLRYGVPSTLITGDFLLTRAFSLCARLDRFVIDATEKACIELTEGEIEELPLSQRETTLAGVIEVSRRKTAALFRLSAECGAHLAGASPHATELLASCGESIGLAFQVIDDILDITSSQQVLGKKPGQDLREQKPSIVNFIWLAHGSQLANSLLQTSRDGPPEDDVIERAITEIMDCGVIEQARRHALNFSLRAIESLDALRSCSPQTDAGAAEDLISLVAGAYQRVC